MSNSERLTGRNALIAAMFEDANQLKHFYRFIALNPHINLHDACNILLARPDATICYPYEEWNELGRQVIRGKKSIAYYDYDGYKQYVFDVSDTRGESFTCSTMPIGNMLIGLNELNGADLSGENDSDYTKVLNGAKFYLHEQGLISGNEQRDELLAEGVAYLLYAKAGMPNDEQISLQGLPFTYKDNADFVKEVYVQAEMLAQEIEDSYRNKQNEITVIDDTEEETVSDEPIVSVEQTEHIHEGQTQVEELSQPEYYPLYKRYMEVQKTKPDAIVLIKNGDFYEVLGENAETISKETNLTLTGRDVGLDERVPMCGIPQHFLDEFLNKILEKHGALLVESDDEPMYVLSHAEALEQSAEAEEKVKPELVEIADEEPCFEKGIKPYTVTFELCDQIVEFLYKNSNKEKIFISWFGGEPLMAFDKLKYINDKLKEKGLKVTSKITTNGSLITDEVVTYAKENNINVFQVTVDDIGEKYNNIKNYVSLKNGYRVVVDNIKKLLNAGITVSIRINHKSEEFEYAKTVLENLKETLGDRENLHIYLAALTLHNQKLFAESKENHPYLKLLRYSVVTDNKIRNWKNNAVYEKNDDLLSQYFLNPIGLSCGMEMDDKIIINADGKLYKCHRLAGREGHSCGDVYSGVNKESAEYLRFSDSEIREDKCKTCSLLPLCHGGCKANKVLYPECDNCIVIKNFIGELILTYYNDIQSCNK